MNHNVPIDWMAKIEQERIRQDAIRSRTVASATDCKPGFQERLAIGLGAALIAAGQRLRAPYEPALAREPEALQSGC